jgi:hypothetical protein
MSKAVVADEGGEAVSERLSLAGGRPVGEEGEQLGELDGVAEFEADLRHVISSVRCARRGVG